MDLGLVLRPPVRRGVAVLAAAPGAFVPEGALTGLRLEAIDLGSSHGSGAAVTGPADALLLAMTGRPTGLDALTGDGVAVLGSRFAPR